MLSPSKLTPAVLALALAGVVAAAPAHAQGPVTAKLVPSGASDKIGGYAPQRLLFTAEKPAQVTKLPDGLTASQYGLLKFGAKQFAFVLDEPATGAPKLFVDSNGNGDLTDDPAVVWTPYPYKAQDGTELKRYMGNITLPLTGADNKSVGSAALGLYRFDKNDTARAALKNTLLYYRDYAAAGTITLGAKTYPFMLDDSKAAGDFTDPKAVGLLIDVNGNGKYDRRGESFLVGAPFNIGGTTYEVRGLTPTGGSFTVAKSAQTVAEVLPPQDLSTGKKAITFAVKTTDGKDVQFPTSYKGKLVLLDFWATWCGPCIGELPNLTKAYETYHPKGFEILGISLDRENAAAKLASFTAEKNMTWPQVYDGKFWSAEIAQLYSIDSIPAAFLVDGDTGAVIASGNALRGPGLAKVLAEALAKKNGRQAQAKTK